MDEEPERRICNSCKQELSHSAYYRHLHDKDGSICPARKSPYVDSDSTFDLGSESDAQESMFPDICSPVVDMLSESISDSDSDSDGETSSASGEEVWEASDMSASSSEEDNEVTDEASSMLNGISIFLNLLHLCYMLPERAMLSLLRFMATLFIYIAHICKSPVLQEVASTIPKSLYGIHKCFTTNSRLLEYAICPKCCTLYKRSDCITTENGIPVSKQCEHVEFPDHSQRSRRTKCNAVLLKKIKVSNKDKLVPQKMFIYQSVSKTLQEMATRPSFLEMCDRWRERRMNMPQGTLGDIYDGRVWESFQVIDGQPFLSVPNNLCLGLNIDWFNPFSETLYSAGAIYLTIFNLPRTERYKLENIILVGMIPGPREPKDLNPFLKPFVDEMNELFTGITFRNPASFLSVSTIRAVLVCVMCDIPATRKV